MSACYASTAGVTNPNAEYEDDWYCAEHQCWAPDGVCPGATDEDGDDE